MNKIYFFTRMDISRGYSYEHRIQPQLHRLPLITVSSRKVTSS